MMYSKVVMGGLNNGVVARSAKVLLLMLILSLSVGPNVTLAAAKNTTGLTSQSVVGYELIKQKFRTLTLRSARAATTLSTTANNGTLRVLFKAKRASSEPVSSSTGAASLTRIEAKA